MKKKLFIVSVIIILIILLFPQLYEIDDGGSVRYQAILYSVTKYHILPNNGSTSYTDGWGIEILGQNVYYNVYPAANNAKQD